MRNTGNFIRKNQRVLAVSFLLASICSCKKTVMEPPPETMVDVDKTMAMASTTTTGAIANLLYYENADGPTLFSTLVSKQTSTSYGITASTTTFYNGIKSARFELRSSDPEIKNGTRAEISFPDCTNLNRWYAFALFAPGAQYKIDTDDDVISQWHQGGGATPALCLRVKSDRLYLRVLGTWLDLGVFEKDKWRAYVMHVKHSAGSDGLVEIWRDGAKILNRTGANMYKIEGEFHAPNWKLGIYKSDWNGTSGGTSQTTVRVLHFDDIKLGNEYATYNNMIPVPTIPTDNSSTTTPTSGAPGFYLVNADTEKEVLTITNGQTISLSALNIEKVNIRAVISTSNIGSLKFILSGQESKTFFDNKAPYALHGDDGNGNYYYGNWNPPAPGTYTLKVAPYSAANGGGYQAGPSQTITFTITK